MKLTIKKADVAMLKQEYTKHPEDTVAGCVTRGDLIFGGIGTYVLILDTERILQINVKTFEPYFDLINTIDKNEIESIKVSRWFFRMSIKITRKDKSKLKLWYIYSNRSDKEFIKQLKSYLN